MLTSQGPSAGLLDGSRVPSSPEPPKRGQPEPPTRISLGPTWLHRNKTARPRGWLANRGGHRPPRLPRPTEGAEPGLSPAPRVPTQSRGTDEGHSSAAGALGSYCALKITRSSPTPGPAQHPHWWELASCHRRHVFPKRRALGRPCRSQAWAEHTPAGSRPVLTKPWEVGVSVSPMLCERKRAWR